LEIKEVFTMNEKEKILEAMKKAGEPLNAGKIAELTGLDRKVVDKAMADMKKDGSIVSPVRCKWEPAKK
jgi:predicted transcriptional regulator